MAKLMDIFLSPIRFGRQNSKSTPIACMAMKFAPRSGSLRSFQRRTKSV